MTIGLIGAGSWGTTLAVHLASLGHQVLLWAYDPEQRRALRAERENRLFLPGVPLPPNITVVDTASDAATAQVVGIATPTQHIRSVLSEVSPDLLAATIVISLAKGIEQESLLRISQMLEQTHGVPPERFVVLSGPSHAEEVAARIPTLVVAASPSGRAVALVQQLFTADWFRVYASQDLVGVELGGALKNVIAVSAGIIDGLGYGDNTKAALITRGVAEITRMGAALGASAETFSGLSGMGDLIVTCTSRHSRNRYLGEQIGRGRRLREVVAEMTMIAEGVGTTQSANELARRIGVETPIIGEMYRVLFEDRDPREATLALMRREVKSEVWA